MFLQYISSVEKWSADQNSLIQLTHMDSPEEGVRMTQNSALVREEMEVARK